ncbi:zinc-ribbon domain containing protein [Brevibacillus sp. NRS-1366]|uniref:zinc-ribbon domain containing protein n=1 Tax=Brevibacillus sp. NRS-1366 TaxID=3233899 RepID=UPI003D2187DE
MKARQVETEYLKCWECGDRFIFEADEQKFYKLRGFVPPKRCPACRERKWLREMGIDDV